MSKQGTEYELFVKDIYEHLNHADGLSDVELQHDVRLSGAAGVEHQIDIFWKFTKGGVTYRVAVECKDYKNRVSKEKIAAFHAILHDIGNIQGIFVSKMGFQSGAIEYADKYGIQLMEIRHPIDSDWEGRAKDFHFIINARSVEEVQPRIIVNKARMEEQGIIISGNEGFGAFTTDVSVRFDRMIAGNDVLADNDVRTICELVNILPVGEPSQGNKYIFVFENAVLVHDDKEIPIDAIEFTYDICKSTQYLDIRGEDIVKAIVKRATGDGKSGFFTVPGGLDKT